MREEKLSDFKNSLSFQTLFILLQQYFPCPKSLSHKSIRNPRNADHYLKYGQIRCLHVKCMLMHSTFFFFQGHCQQLLADVSMFPHHIYHIFGPCCWKNILCFPHTFGKQVNVSERGSWRRR